MNNYKVPRPRIEFPNLFSTKIKWPNLLKVNEMLDDFIESDSKRIPVCKVQENNWGEKLHDSCFTKFSVKHLDRKFTFLDTLIPINNHCEEGGMIVLKAINHEWAVQMYISHYLQLVRKSNLTSGMIQGKFRFGKSPRNFYVEEYEH